MSCLLLVDFSGREISAEPVFEYPLFFWVFNSSIVESKCCKCINHYDPSPLQEYYSQNFLISPAVSTIKLSVAQMDTRLQRPNCNSRKPVFSAKAIMNLLATHYRRPLQLQGRLVNQSLGFCTSRKPSYKRLTLAKNWSNTRANCCVFLREKGWGPPRTSPASRISSRSLRRLR